MGDPITGRLGAIQGWNNVATFSVTHSGELKEAVHSGTRGGTERRVGNESWNGTIKFYGLEPPTGFLPGIGFTFAGSIDGTNGVTGPCVIDSFEQAINIEGGDLISSSIKISGNGALTKGAVAYGTNQPVMTQPNTVVSSRGCKLMLATPGAHPSYTEVADCRNINLSVTAKNVEYVSSTTSGWKKRARGNLDLTLNWQVYEDKFQDLPTIGSYCLARVYVNATDYWEIGFLQIGEHSNLEVDIESNKLIGAQINASWSCIYDSGSATTEGMIITPSGQDWWPEES